MPTTTGIRWRSVALVPQGIALLAALGAFTATARAAAPPLPASDPFLAQLAGRWQLVGTVRGQAVRYRGEARWVLEHGWLRLTLVDVTEPPAYQAQVFIGFDPKAGDYVAHWLDRFGAAGARVAGSGRRDGQTLVLTFPYDGAAFRDTLTLAADGTSGSLLLEAHEPDGSWSTFASYTLTRRR
jgi:hypothetical protein